MASNNVERELESIALIRSQAEQIETLNRKIALYEKIVIVSIGTSCLTKDLVWCECGRGLSLSGKWRFCPSCGGEIDQQSYDTAVANAVKHGARLYVDSDLDTAMLAADKLLREQAEQIEKLRNANAVIARQHVEQTDQIDQLTSERDALAIALQAQNSCKRCGGRGFIGERHGIIYDTDSPDEIANAYHDVPCTHCKCVDPVILLANHDAALVAPLNQRIEELEKSELHEIEQRDYREEKFNELVANFGVETEYSNFRGFDEIISDCEDVMVQKESEIAQLQSHNERKEAMLAEKDAEILRLENSILEADDYRTETGERDITRAYRHINAEATGIREGREKIARENTL